MSRQWISNEDRRWVMVCDSENCETRSDARDRQDDFPLVEFIDLGWYIAHVYGDKCPKCVEASGGMAELMRRSEGANSPNLLMLQVSK